MVWAGFKRTACAPVRNCFAIRASDPRALAPSRLGGCPPDRQAPSGRVMNQLMVLLAILDKALSAPVFVYDLTAKYQVPVVRPSMT